MMTLILYNISYIKYNVILLGHDMGKYVFCVTLSDDTSGMTTVTHNRLSRDPTRDPQGNPLRAEGPRGVSKGVPSGVSRLTEGKSNLVILEKPLV